MAEINKTLGEIIRDKRIEKYLSLRDLAKLISIAPSYLSDIENDRRVPAEEIIRNIVQALDLDADDLMAGILTQDNKRIAWDDRNWTPATGARWGRVR